MSKSSVNSSDTILSTGLLDISCVFYIPQTPEDSCNMPKAWGINGVPLNEIPDPDEPLEVMDLTQDPVPEPKVEEELMEGGDEWKPDVVPEQGAPVAPLSPFALTARRGRGISKPLRRRRPYRNPAPLPRPISPPSPRREMPPHLSKLWRETSHDLNWQGPQISKTPKALQSEREASVSRAAVLEIGTARRFVSFATFSGFATSLPVVLDPALPHNVISSQLVADLGFPLDETEYAISVPVASNDPRHHHTLGTSLISIGNLGLDVAPSVTLKFYVIADQCKAALSGRALAELGLVYSRVRDCFLLHDLEAICCRPLDETLLENVKLKRF